MAKEGDILSTTEQTHQQDLERLKALRYMDDDFMTVCLADNFEGVELILRIVLGQEDIKIKSIRTQEPLKNLQGRSAILDVHAIDSTKKEFDVEIQRSDAGAGAKRARYFKQDEKGVATMCKIMEDMRNEAAREAVRKTTKENARRLLKLGKIRIDEVSDCFPDLLDSDVKELEAEVIQLA